MAYVAHTAIPDILLTKILQQLATAALAVVLGIVQHGFDTLLVLRQAFFIDGRGQHDVLAILTPLQIADVGHLLAGNELDDVLFGEQFQRLIDIVGLRPPW